MDGTGEKGGVWVYGGAYAFLRWEDGSTADGAIHCHFRYERHLERVLWRRERDRSVIFTNGAV